MKIRQLVKEKPKQTRTLETIINHHMEIEGWVKSGSFLCERQDVKFFQKNYTSIAENAMAEVQGITEKYFEVENGKPKLVNGKPVLLEGKTVDEYTIDARKILHKQIEWIL